MVLWTIMPIETVLENDSIKKEQLDSKMIDYHGRHLLVETISETQCRIIRLISTDPYDYLDPIYQPGSILNYKGLH